MSATTETKQIETKEVKTEAKTKKPAGKKRGAKKSAVSGRSKVAPDAGVLVDESRVRYWLDEGGINAEVETASAEVRDGEPHEVKTKSKVDGKTTVVNTTTS